MKNRLPDLKKKEKKKEIGASHAFLIDANIKIKIVDLEMSFRQRLNVSAVSGSGSAQALLVK